MCSFNKALKQWCCDLGLETEVIGRPLFEIFPFLPDKVRDEYRWVFEQRQALVTEETTTIGDIEFITETSKAPIFEGNRVVQVVTVIRDITDREQAVRALQEREQFLNDVFESIQDGISVLDRNLIIRRINGVMNQWYVGNLPLEGKKCYAVYHNRDEPCQLCPTLRCFQSGKSERQIVPGPPGSSVEWLEVFSYPIRKRDSAEISGAVKFVRNTTDLKQAEEKLRQSEEKYRSIFEYGGIGIFQSTFEGKHITMNPAFACLLGYESPDEAMNSISDIAK